MKTFSIKYFFSKSCKKFLELSTFLRTLTKIIENSVQSTKAIKALTINYYFHRVRKSINSYNSSYC